MTSNSTECTIILTEIGHSNQPTSQSIPWSGVLLEKLIITHLVNKFSAS